MDAQCWRRVGSPHAARSAAAYQTLPDRGSAVCVAPVSARAPGSPAARQVAGQFLRRPADEAFSSKTWLTRCSSPVGCEVITQTKGSSENGRALTGDGHADESADAEGGGGGEQAEEQLAASRVECRTSRKDRNGGAHEAKPNAATGDAGHDG